MRDFLPEDIRRREYVIGVIKRVYERYGFEPLETPSVENLETLLGKYGDEGNQLIFKILKRGEHEATGEADLALRYVGELPGPQRIPSYVEADARLGWVVRPGLTLGLAGHDLLHDQHAEFFSVPQRFIQRRAELQAEWRF